MAQLVDMPRIKVSTHYITKIIAEITTQHKYTCVRKVHAQTQTHTYAHTHHIYILILCDMLTCY